MAQSSLHIKPTITVGRAKVQAFSTEVLACGRFTGGCASRLAVRVHVIRLSRQWARFCPLTHGREEERKGLLSVASWALQVWPSEVRWPQTSSAGQEEMHMSGGEMN